MKIVKKLLAVLICLCLALSCVLVQADEAETVSSNMEVMNVLNALGITEYTEYDLQNSITRGQFYELLCKTAGYPKVTGTDVIFADMAPTNELEAYARTLYKVGIISPDNSGKIYPSNPITGKEAVAIVLKVLGYGPMAEAKGGYPAGYLAVAATTDIDEDVNLSGDLTKGNACQLLYNALSTDMMVPQYSLNGKPIEHKVEEDTNLLNTSLGIEVAEGVVEGIDVSRLTGANDVYPFCVEINGIQIDVEYIPNAHDFLGYYVKAYYKAGRNQLNKMLYIEITDDNEEVVMDIEDITEITATNVKAFTSKESSKQKTHRIKRALPVIYNGVSTDAALEMNLISGKNGTLKLLDNTGDGEADVAFVNAYENFVVSHYDNDNKVVYHKYDSSKKLSVDNTIDEPYVLLYDDLGVEISPNKLKNGNIITVFESADDAHQKYIKAYVSSAVVTGVVDAIEDDESIFVNGTEYELDKVNKANYSKFIGVGEGVKAYLDIYGNVADLEPDSSSSFKYGFITAFGTEGTLDKVTKFKLYTEDEQEHILPCAQNIRIDGEKYRYTDEDLCENLYAATKEMFGKDMPEGAIYTLVRFSQNSKGEINAIDTIMETTSKVASRDGNLTEKNSLFMIYAKERFEIIGSSVMLGPKVVLTTNTKVGSLNSDGDPEVTTAGKAFLSTANVEAFAFYTAREQIVTDLMITPNMIYGLGVSGSKLSIVKRVSKGMDAEGEEADFITIVSPSGEDRAPIADGLSIKGNSDSTDPDLTAATIPVSEFKNGDIVRYQKGQDGRIRRVDLIYRASTKTPHTAQSTISGTDNNYWNGAFSNDLLYKVGYVFEKFNEGFYLYFNDALTGNMENDEAILAGVTLDDCWFMNTGATGPTVYKYDSTEPVDLRISMSTVASLEDYAHTGSDASFVLVNLYHGTPQAVVEIK